MTPDDAKGYVENLERKQLVHLKNNGAVDIIVVDQQRGQPLSATGLNLGQRTSKMAGLSLPPQGEFTEEGLLPR
jgi:hypothetical protein